MLCHIIHNLILILVFMLTLSVYTATDSHASSSLLTSLMYLSDEALLLKINVLMTSDTFNLISLRKHYMPRDIFM